MKRALGVAAAEAEAEVGDRMNRPLGVAAAAAEAEVDDPMKRALGEAAAVAEAEVGDRMNRPLGVAAAAAEAEVDDPMKRALGEAAAVAEAEVDDRMNRPLGVAAAAAEAEGRRSDAKLSVLLVSLSRRWSLLLCTVLAVVCVTRQVLRRSRAFQRAGERLESACIDPTAPPPTAFPHRRTTRPFTYLARHRAPYPLWASGLVEGGVPHHSEGGFT